MSEQELEDVVVKIAGKEVRAWNDLELSLTLDSFDTCAFVAPLSKDRTELKSIFQPFSYKPITIAAGEDVFSGTLLPVEPVNDPNVSSVKIQGYAKPGVLNDCTLPASAFPIEFSNVNLFEITKRVCSHFGIEVESLPQPIPGIPAEDPPFERVAVKTTEKVLEFLSNLAKQRNYVIGNTPAGKIAYVRPGLLGLGIPIAVLVEGSHGLSEVKATFNAQEYYSEVTAIGTSKLGGKGAKHTEKNPLAPEGVFRPHTFEVDAAEATSLQQAAKAELGRMFGNMVSYSFTIPSWRTQAGQLWRPNKLITLTAPGALIEKPTMLVIRDVVLRQSKDEESAKITCVLPGSFAGESPTAFPWA